MKRKNKTWTDDEVELLKRLYPNSDKHKLKKALGRSERSISRKAGRLGLRKTKEHLHKIGHENYKRTANRYGKIPGGGAKSESHPLKLPVGTIRKSRGRGAKRSSSYIIKVKDGGPQNEAWRSLQEHVWLRDGGDPIKDGEYIWFKDINIDRENLDNYKIENLVKMTRSEGFKRVYTHNYPREIAGLMIQLGKLKKELSNE